MESSPHGTNSRLLSCFLCLKSNSRTHLNAQDESDSCVNAEEKASSFHEFSLRNLCRYLNLLRSDKEKKDFSDLKMPICEDCSRLTTEFNELYYLLEEIKLRLNWCIQKLVVVMTKAENKVKVVEIEEDENKILELWRTHTLDQMKAFNHASFPRVLLHKNKRKRVCPRIKIKEEEETPTKIQKEDEEIKLVRGIETKDQNEVMWPSLVEQLSADQHLVEEDYSSSHENDNQHNTPSLSKLQTFRGNFELDIQMKGDVDVAETFMQISSMDGDSAKGYIVPVPGYDYVDATNVESENQIASQRERKVRPFRVVRRVRPASHNSEAIFKDPLLEENPNTCTSRNPIHRAPTLHRSKKKLTSCPYCHFKCTSAGPCGRRTMETHHVRFHPEHFLIDEKDKAEGLWHEQFHTILTKIVFPNFIRNIGLGPHRSCKSCGVTYKSHSTGGNSTLVKRHLIFCHKLELKEKLKAILADPLLELDETLKRMEGKVISQRRKPIMCSLKCSYCRFQCSSVNTRNSMRRHLARFHPEQFLIKEGKPNEMRGLELRHPQIQRILTDMIFPKFITVTGQHTKCSLCKKKFSNIQKYENIVSVRIHVIRRHKTELRESIKDAVEDSTLEDKLAVSNANGVTCSCGVYILKSEALTQTYHKNYCIDGPKSQEKVHSEEISPMDDDGDES